MASHHHYSSISGGLALAFGGPSSASTPLFAAAGQDGEHGGDNSSLASLLEVRRGPSASPQHGSPTLTTFDRAFDKAAADEPTAKRLHATQPVAEMGGRQQQSDRGWYERDEEGQELEVRDCDAQEPGEQEEGEEDEDTQQQAAEEPPQLTNTISNGLLIMDDQLTHIEHKIRELTSTGIQHLDQIKADWIAEMDKLLKRMQDYRVEQHSKLSALSFETQEEQQRLNKAKDLMSRLGIDATDGRGM